MASNDMHHLGFLDAVRHADVETIREKEATYQGSWKRAGGSSAWFMMRRNMDRLITMMAPPKDEIQFSLADLDDAIQSAAATHHGDCTMDYTVVQYLRDSFVSEDVFRKIEENPDGQDGTVLACIRDLRCYLTLIEAEMMAQGIVPAPNAPLEEGAPVEIKIDIPASSAHPLHGRDGGALFLNRFYGVTIPDGNTQICRIVDMYPAINEVQITFGGGEYQVVRASALSELEIQQDDAVLGAIIPIPEGGGHHEKFDGAPGEFAPWAINLDYVIQNDMKGTATLENFYRQQTTHLWVLEPAVPYANNRIPVRLASYYSNVNGDWWMLHLENCPPDARDWFPRLTRELNRFEYDGLPEWQQLLYKWDEKQGKYTIISDAWARD